VRDITRADGKSQVRQCLDFWTADFWSLLAYELAEQKPKHCLTGDFLSALDITMSPSRKNAALDLTIPPPTPPP